MAKKPKEPIVKGAVGNNPVDPNNQRRGPLTPMEKAFIGQNYADFTPEQLAIQLRRNPKSIKRYMHDQGFMALPSSNTLEPEEVEIRSYLHGLGWWGTVLEQFTDREIRFFQQMWYKLYKQFDSDVLPSEEIQIRKFITLEIMKDRTLVKIHQSSANCEKLEALYRDELELEKEDRDRDVIRGLREDVSAIKSGLPSLNGEYRDLCKEQTVVEKGLSASRNDRIKNIQDASKNWASVLKSLEDPKIRREVGRYMEVMRLARDKEMMRLTGLHKFVDGEYDRPMLSGKLQNFYDAHDKAHEIREENGLYEIERAELDEREEVAKIGREMQDEKISDEDLSKFIN